MSSIQIDRLATQRRWATLFVTVLALTTLAAGCGAPKPDAVPNATTESPVSVETPDATTESPGAVEAPDADQSAGSPAPLSKVTEVNAQKLGEILAENLGKTTVLNIWATWCGPCVKEMPDLVKFYNDMDKETTAFVSLSVDAAPDMETEIPAFQKDFNIPFPIYVLSGRDDEGLLKALKTEFEGAIPVTLLYRPDGSLASTALGAVTHEKLLAMIANLEEAPSPES